MLNSWVNLVKVLGKPGKTTFCMCWLHLALLSMYYLCQNAHLFFSPSFTLLICCLITFKRVGIVFTVTSSNTVSFPFSLTSYLDVKTSDCAPYVPSTLWCRFKIFLYHPNLIRIFSAVSVHLSTLQLYLMSHPLISQF